LKIKSLTIFAKNGKHSGFVAENEVEFEPEVIYMRWLKVGDVNMDVPYQDSNDPYPAYIVIVKKTDGTSATFRP